MLQDQTHLVATPTVRLPQAFQRPSIDPNYCDKGIHPFIHKNHVCMLLYVNVLCMSRYVCILYVMTCQGVTRYFNACKYMQIYVSECKSTSRYVNGYRCRYQGLSMYDDACALVCVIYVNNVMCVGVRWCSCECKQAQGLEPLDFAPTSSSSTPNESPPWRSMASQLKLSGSLMRHNNGLGHSISNHPTSTEPLGSHAIPCDSHR